MGASLVHSIRPTWPNNSCEKRTINSGGDTLSTFSGPPESYTTLFCLIG